MNSRKLYKVKVETELMVMALNKREAEEVAKAHVVNEISAYGESSASLVTSFSDIPLNWKRVIPYSIDTINQESRICSEIFADTNGEDMGSEDLEELIEIHKQSKPPVKINDNSNDDIVPETRPDPKSRELDWRETTSGRPLPPLKFKI
jgi:hypothetical protein